MREILFRGKRTDNGNWVYGYIVIKPYGSFIEKVEQIEARDNLWHEYYPVIPETVGQYTGLKDKNGKKIFEGDIIGTDRFGVGHQIDGYVVYNENNGQYELVFDLDDNGKMYVMLERNVIVEGNIHDNPEIMNKKAVVFVTKDKNGKRKYRYSKGYPDELKIPND